jgi:hypothetical protein
MITEAMNAPAQLSGQEQLVGGAAWLTHAVHLPSWAVEVRCERKAEDLWIERRFVGASNAIISREVATLTPGGHLGMIDAAQRHLDEATSARFVPEEAGGWTIVYHLIRGEAVTERSERVVHPPLSLATLPWQIAAQRRALLAGKAVRMTYPVLKVQRSATVRLAYAATGDGAQVSVTPVNPLLRVLFGATVLSFDADLTEWRGYAGLLDPRDRKRSGRWRDYLGRITLDKPMNLSATETY